MSKDKFVRISTNHPSIVTIIEGKRVLIEEIAVNLFACGEEEILNPLTRKQIEKRINELFEGLYDEEKAEISDMGILEVSTETQIAFFADTQEGIVRGDILYPNIHSTEMTANAVLCSSRVAVRMVPESKGKKGRQEFKVRI